MGWTEKLRVKMTPETLKAYQEEKGVEYVPPVYVELTDKEKAAERIIELIFDSFPNNEWGEGINCECERCIPIALQELQDAYWSWYEKNSILISPGYLRQTK